MPSVATAAKAVYPPAVGEPPTRDFLPEDTAALPVYMTLQPIRRAARHLTVAPGGLLPRLFTRGVVAPFLERYGSPVRKWGGCFLSRCLCGCPRLPVRKYGALCCPDFPHACIPWWNHARDGLSGCCFVAQIYVKSINFGGKYVSLFKLTALLYDDNKHVHA